MEHKNKTNLKITKLLKMTFLKKTSVILFLLIFFSFGVNIANATREQTSAFVTSSGISQGTTDSISDIVAAVIRALLSLLGIIFIILMIYGGFMWMTASGDDEQVKKALSVIKNAIIGLIIVVGAYAITYFVFTGVIGGGVGAASMNGS